MIVWWLFQSEAAPPEFKGCTSYSFGIGGGSHTYTRLDLSDSEVALKFLIEFAEKYGWPDIIFASPPCETWVVITVGHKWRYTTSKVFNLHYKDKNFTANDFTEALKIKRLNGENTAMTTAKVIKYFKPKYWFIENGNSSLIFHFLNVRCGMNGFLNKCSYANYRFDVWKPTIIYSNKSLFLYSKRPNRKLNLITTGKRKNKITYASCKAKGIEVFLKDDYAGKSKVPEALYRAIIQQLPYKDGLKVV